MEIAIIGSSGMSGQR